MRCFVLCSLLLVLFSCPAAAGVPVAGVTLNETEFEIQIEFSDVSYTGQLIATISPANALNKNVIWSSDNTRTATVDTSGLVTGISPGIAIITVRTEDGGYTANCTVSVADIKPVP